MRYAHTSIAALDWRNLAQFYVDVFGCVIQPVARNLCGDWLDKGIGLTNARLEGIHLLLPGYGEKGPTLEIFTYQSTIEQEPLMANHTGFTHIAFEVEDVNKIFTKALSHGAIRLGEVTRKIIKGSGALTFVYFRDPENNIIEIQSWEK